MSSTSAEIARTRTPDSGASSYLVIVGPREMLMTFALTLKLVRVSMSFFAVVCSSSLISVFIGETGADKSESGGKTYF